MEIKTLVRDIYKTVATKDGWFTEALSSKLGSDIATTLRGQLGDERPAPRLRLSQMGPRCPCALWHSIHHPELAEPLQPWAEIKFSYGHILEALVISLAKASGHDVRGEQDEVVLDGIRGHRDCVIDGCIVDVKSASSLSFNKFKNKSIAQNDTFGYLDQLDGYILGCAEDDLVTNKDTGYLLAIDKTLGHICLYEHKLRADSIRQRIARAKHIVNLPTAPACTCRIVEDGKSGNEILGFPATYNSFKYACFPNLRTFIFADGPRYFTKLVRRPAAHVMEVDRNSKVVYNYP